METRFRFIGIVMAYGGGTGTPEDRPGCFPAADFYLQFRVLLAFAQADSILMPGPQRIITRPAQS